MPCPNPTGPLDFSDWLDARDNSRNAGWIIVGQVWQTEEGRISTFSYLVDIAQVHARVKTEPRGVNSGDAVTEIVDAYIEGRAYGATADPERDHHDPDSAVAQDKRPFVIETTYYGYRPLDLDLVQAFVLYWNGWWEGDTLRRIDTDGTLHDVARKRRDGERVVLKVDAHHLRAFLAVAHAGLVRIHDHQRYGDATVETDVDDNHVDASGQFRRVVRNADSIVDYAAFGRVIGKDVVEPYRGINGDPRAPSAGHEHFIIGRDRNGVELQASADETLGEAPFLTPVYHRAEVLRRYYDSPGRYTVRTGYLQCLELWGIPFDRRKDDLVQVYLGDLGHIPHIEQRHWRAQNVAPPGGGISVERFRRDFGVEWVDPAGDPAFDFKRAMRATNEAAIAKFGRSLYRPLEKGDAFIYDGLRVPVSDGPEESDAQLTGLAKATIESFDNDLLRSEIPADVDTTNAQSIALLEKMLQSWGAVDIAAIVGPHKELQAMRSTGSAHRRGGRAENVLRRGHLLDLDNKELVAEIMRRMTSALELLAAQIAQHP